ncbi:hypothetical protein FPV67DRAFT_1419684 [Lyophyllum atratum]|nr:hypothetical protein FPV67DRAFT_1419684 [Lyophyllum atratum]
MVFRCWPRAPDGKCITPENTLPGKTTPNGLQLWGSTLFDFYHVRRIPDLPNLRTITTGSKLVKWMKANGELDHAQDEIEWAEMEEEPKVIDPWSPREDIEKMEENIRKGVAGQSMPAARAVKGKQASTGSIFEPSNYPAPWPLVPFSYQTTPLRSIIDPDRLPKKLIVHDPWNLLAVRTQNRYGRAERSPKDMEWTSRPDRVHVYRLQLSASAEAARLKAKAEAEAKAPSKSSKDPAPELSILSSASGDETSGTEKQLGGYLIRPPAVPGPIPPPIFVQHDLPPRPLAPVPSDPEPIGEAHLYISPAHPIGKGNHSIVYQAEWELPRSAVLPSPSTDPVLCKDCVNADVARILKECDGENGEHMDPQWKEMAGEVSIIQEGRPPVTFHVVESVNLNNPDAKPDGREFSPPDTCSYRAEFEGRVRPIRTSVAWQDPAHPTCEHLSPPVPVPPTVKMRVVAKLSNEDDDHLQRESRNYQKFERHMYEEWSGFNVLPPMHDPVPVGAMVPRFYGYYVPEEEDEEAEHVVEVQEPVNEGQMTDADTSSDADGGSETGEKGERGDSDARKPVKKEREPRGHFSPILLLEDCGREVRPGDLTLDQKHEALSFIYRFHHLGWAHGSVYARNLLIQPGPLDVPPSERSKDNPSFRLIDFGRSYHVDDEESDRAWSGDRHHEESEMEKIFGLGLWC